MTKKVEIEEKEIDAPYELPEGWKWVRLGDVVETSKEKTENFSEEIKYVGLEHIDSNGTIIGYDSATEIKSLKNVFHQNQILYGKLRPYLNKHDIADFDGVCSTDILVFNAKDGFSNKYINYFFNLPFFIDFVISNSKGINLPRVSESTVLSVPFPLPPTIAEQQRIVNRIESMFAKLDEAKEKAQNVVDSFETRKAAILHQAFNGTLTAKWRKENGVSDDSWEEKNLEEISTKITDGEHITPKRVDSYCGYYLLSARNILNGSIKLDDVDYVGKEEFDRIRRRCNPEKNDILISCSGSVGRVCVIQDDNQYVMVRSAAMIKVKESNPFFVAYMLQSYNVQQQIEKTKKQSCQANLFLGAIKELHIPVPEILEQQEIVRILDTILEKERTAKSAAEQVLEQIDLLKKSILARAFRGEL